MFQLDASQVMLLLVILVLIFGRHRLRRFGARGDELDRLRAELGGMPVYSAETIRGKEAEFIRDRMPKRFPYLLVIGVLAVGAAFWWLSHR